jgi:ABC-type glycerol-3-phosphate transport system substrate-binding protein
MKKFLVFTLAGVAAFSAVGCGVRGGEEADKSKTQLYVATFDGGFGSSWMDEIEKRFEAKYANVSFEPGKVGVQIIAKPERELTNETLVNKISGMTHEVFFSEAINYYELQSRGLLYDISEAVTKPINYDFVTGTVDSSDPETKSIQEKMINGVHKDYFGANGQYYGLPFYEATYGIIYDIDLFEKNKLYFAEDGTNFIRKSTEKRSKGPDGTFGTSDDGLPATYEDFFKLCDYMVSSRITPITWTGVSPYVNALVESLQADYEGEEQMRLNFTASGTATNIVKEFDGETPVLESVEITQDNGYVTWTKQAGKYYGLKFAEELSSNTNYYDISKVTSSGYMQTDAQNAVIMDKFTQNKKPVAMLIDGSWWLNEAKSAFAAAEQRFGVEAGMQNRKFGLMPLPKATEAQVGQKYSVMEVNSSICFVRGNVDKKKDALIKEFIQFCHTEESLREFTSITYTTKPFAYEMTEAEVNAMPYWGQEMYRLHNENAYVSSYSTSGIYKKNASKFTQIWEGKMFESQIGNKTYNIVTNAMIPLGNNATLSAKEYFEGLAVGITADDWKNGFIPQ